MSFTHQKSRVSRCWCSCARKSEEHYAPHWGSRKNRHTDARWKMLVQFFFGRWEKYGRYSSHSFGICHFLFLRIGPYLSTDFPFAPYFSLAVFYDPMFLFFFWHGQGFIRLKKSAQWSCWEWWAYLALRDRCSLFLSFFKRKFSFLDLFCSTCGEYPRFFFCISSYDSAHLGTTIPTRKRCSSYAFLLGMGRVRFHLRSNCKKLFPISTSRRTGSLWRRWKILQQEFPKARKTWCPWTSVEKNELMPFCKQKRRNKLPICFVCWRKIFRISSRNFCYWRVPKPI